MLVPYVIYIISCDSCGDQYVSSATDFKAKFRILKSDTKTKKNKCGASINFRNEYCNNNNPDIFFQVQLIESVQSFAKQGGKLWEKENIGNIS